MLQEALLIVAADTLNQHTSIWARRSCILCYSLAGRASTSGVSVALVTSCHWAQQITPGDRSLVISISIARFPTAVLEVDEGSSNRESFISYKLYHHVWAKVNRAQRSNKATSKDIP